MKLKEDWYSSDEQNNKHRDLQIQINNSKTKKCHVFAKCPQNLQTSLLQRRYNKQINSTHFETKISKGVSESKQGNWEDRYFLPPYNLFLLNQDILFS